MYKQIKFYIFGCEILIITVIGNDNRQISLAKKMNQKHDTIFLGGNEDMKIVKSILKISDLVVFPLPFTRDNKTINNTNFDILETLNAIQQNTKIFAGMIDKTFKNSNTFDYNNDEEFTLKNALYTAEGAVSMCIENTPFSLSDAKILILGNGRIGKFLSKLLKSFDADITVSARREKDFDYIKRSGLKSIHTEKINDLSTYNVIFNTIPKQVIFDNVRNTINKDCLIIDLASKNSLLVLKNALYIDAKALPAKYCMQSSANALYDCILKILHK